MLTAATASVPSRPTQYRSIRKYSVWNTMLTSMKLVVLSRCLLIEPVVRSCTPLRRYRLAARALLLFHHARDVRHQLLGIVDDAVLDRVLHAADPFALAGGVIELQRAAAVEHLEVLERVVLDDREIGEHAGADRSELRLLSLRLEERLGGVERRAAERLDGMEPGFLQHLQLLDRGEARRVVDEA